MSNNELLQTYFTPISLNYLYSIRLSCSECCMYYYVNEKCIYKRQNARDIYFAHKGIPVMTSRKTEFHRRTIQFVQFCNFLCVFCNGLSCVRTIYFILLWCHFLSLPLSFKNVHTSKSRRCNYREHERLES